MTLVNAAVISKQFSIPKGTIYYYIAKNTIPYYRVRGRVKFNPTEIEKMVKRGKSTSARTW